MEPARSWNWFKTSYHRSNSDTSVEGLSLLISVLCSACAHGPTPSDITTLSNIKAQRQHPAPRAAMVIMCQSRGGEGG